jgi:hypothetical protein
MSADDRVLREAFRFEAADLAANRAGRLSPRQEARLRAGRVGMRLTLGVFAIVMMATVGFVALLNRRLETPGGTWDGAGVAAAVAAAVILVGFWLSWAHLRAAGSRRITVAHGPADVVSDAVDDCRLRVGPTVLRLSGVEQLEAFRAGTEYRVYYLAGSVPIVLSAERPWDHSETADPAAQVTERAEARAELGLFRRGYAIVILLGVLTLGIPLAGIMVGDLPPGLRPLAWITLVAVAIGFVWLGVAWLERDSRSR